MTAPPDAASRRPALPLATMIAAAAAPATALAMLAAVAWAIWIARDWPLVHDASIMHYMVFLMEQGLAPYRDVPDLNMPGAHLSEALVMHTLGGGAVAWRLWDHVLGALAIGACAWIAGPGLRWAGVVGGALGYLIHLADGPWNLGERDWLVAVLLLWALGCLKSALRRGDPAWMAGAALLCGLGASIKPPVLYIGLAFFALAVWLNRPRRPDQAPPIRGGWPAVVLWSALGMIPPTAMMAAYLTWWRAWPAFLDTLHVLIPWYATLMRVPLPEMLSRSAWPLVALAGTVTALWPGRRERGWDLELVFLGILAGLALFLIQDKGWDYHRYTEMAFLALWAALASARAMRRGFVGKVVGPAGLLLCAVAGGALALSAQAAGAAYPVRNLPVLEGDLRRLGGPALSGKVQCLDMVGGGCITALYDLKLVSATSILGDPALFPDRPSAVSDAVQKQFLEALAERPPQVIVISSYSWPADQYDYSRLRNWPAFNAALARRYRLDREVPNIPGGPGERPRGVGYRLYLLDDPKP
ncbi:MAG: hypothetical protein ACXU8Q_03465 [Caulobacteraceae bacterium]